MSYEIDIIVPNIKEAKGLFFAAEPETLFRRINLEPLKKDLEVILRLLDDLTKYKNYGIDEIKLTAGVAIEESGSERAGISLKIFQFGGELGKEIKTAITENNIFEIKIKKNV